MILNRCIKFIHSITVYKTNCRTLDFFFGPDPCVQSSSTSFGHPGLSVFWSVSVFLCQEYLRESIKMQHYAYFLNFLPIQFYKSSKTNNGQVDGACAIVQVNVRERKCKCCQSTLSGPTRGTWALTFSGFGEIITVAF